MQNLSWEAKNAKSDLRNIFSFGLLGESKFEKKTNIYDEKVYYKMSIMLKWQNCYKQA